jgi:transposase
MSKDPPRSFSREFKLNAVERLEAGESGSALALELEVKRELLYRWRDAWRAGGVQALRGRRGRPSKGEAEPGTRTNSPAHLAQICRLAAKLEYVPIWLED